MAPGYAVELKTLSVRPRSAATAGAWRYLEAAYDTVSHLFEALEILRREEANAGSREDLRGRLSNELVDLLRAAIVFTSSGLDACLKRLLNDVLADQIDANPNADGQFKQFVNAMLDEKRISSRWRVAMLSRDPRPAMVALYIEEMTRPSFGRVADVQKAREILGIELVDLPDDRIEQLKPFFSARHAIVHDLDYKDTRGKSVARNPQRMDQVKDHCDAVFQLLCNIITVVAVKPGRLAE